MKQLLLVDDSEVMRRMVKVSLMSIKNRVTYKEAKNGLEALEHLATSHVDLMILDLNMPDMHGLDVLKFVRKQKLFLNLPVIILTTRGDEDNRTTTLKAGASAYLTKPHDLPLLLGTVRKFLEQM